MSRLNLLLLLILTLCAVSLVASQHHARKLFIALGEEQEGARQLDIEYGQLQLELSTWAMHARVEKVARQRLGMRPPEAGRIQIVGPQAAPAGGAR